MPAAPALFEQLEKNLKSDGADLVKRIKVRAHRGGGPAAPAAKGCVPPRTPLS